MARAQGLAVVSAAVVARWRALTAEHRQQAVSALTDLPDDMFQGSGQVFTTLGEHGRCAWRRGGLIAVHAGFEYWTDPARPQDGFITWQTAGEPSATMRAPAVGPDAQSMIGQRLVSEEPMVSPPFAGTCAR